MAMEKATFGAGCFWGVETRFGELSGVIDTAVGYEGGDLEHPTYKEVCTDRTGHAEVVEVTFDNSRLSYEALLDTFFALHDPTQINRQETIFAGTPAATALNLQGDVSGSAVVISTGLRWSF